jgi:hypothetical protein
MEMSKGDFARHIGVTPARVSQMISERLIGADALVGEGRYARINVELASAQIGHRRDPGQAMGNGLKTDLGSPTRSPASPTPREASEDLDEDDPRALILLEKLEGEQRKNRMARIEEARQLGQLVPADEMRRAMGKALQDQLNHFTGMAPDIANAIAAKFELPQRDVLHLVRQVMSERRGVAAAVIAKSAEVMPETVAAELAA